MKSILLSVAIAVCCIATLKSSPQTHSRTFDGHDVMTDKERREMRASEFAANIDSLVVSRNYTFYPSTMQNITSGDTRYIIAYHLFMSMQNDSVAVHLPFEFINYVIYTENFNSEVSDYVETLSDGLWRVTYSIKNSGRIWVVEMLVSNVTGQVQLAIATPDATMRYIGYIEAEHHKNERNRHKRNPGVRKPM